MKENKSTVSKSLYQMFYGVFFLPFGNRFVRKRTKAIYFLYAQNYTQHCKYLTTLGLLEGVGVALYPSYMKSQVLHKNNSRLNLYRKQTYTRIYTVSPIPSVYAIIYTSKEKEHIFKHMFFYYSSMLQLSCNDHSESS